MAGGTFPEGCNLTLCPHRTQHISGHWLVVPASAFWFCMNNLSHDSSELSLITCFRALDNTCAKADFFKQKRINTS